MAVKKQFLKINGMHCTSCSMLIDGDLEDTKGIVSAKTNYAKQMIEVKFNDQEISSDQLIEVIKKTGYDASLMAILTCPKCQSKQSVEMPTDACQHFYRCQHCGELLKPRERECCVFCSYADSKCPPKQQEQL